MQPLKQYVNTWYSVLFFHDVNWLPIEICGSGDKYSPARYFDTIYIDYDATRLDIWYIEYSSHTWLALLNYCTD